MHNPAPNAGPRERAAYRDLLSKYRQQVQGTVMLDELLEVTPRFKLPAPLKQRGDLIKFAAYEPLLRYVQQNYPTYRFTDTAYMMNAEGDPCLPRASQSYKIFSHVVYQGFK